MNVLPTFKFCVLAGHLEELITVISEPSRLTVFVILNLKVLIIWPNASHM